MKQPHETDGMSPFEVILWEMNAELFELGRSTRAVSDRDSYERSLKEWAIKATIIANRLEAGLRAAVYCAKTYQQAELFIEEDVLEAMRVKS